MIYDQMRILLTSQKIDIKEHLFNTSKYMKYMMKHDTKTNSR